MEQAREMIKWLNGTSQNADYDSWAVSTIHKYNALVARS